MAAAQSRRLLACAAAAAGRWPAGTPSPRHFQVRRFTSSPQENGKSSLKDMKRMIEFVRDLKEIFTAGIAYKGHVDSGNLKQLERRILQLEARITFYKNFKWVLVGPIIWILMAVPSTITTYHGVSIEKEKQKNTAEKLSDLKRQIEYLEGRMN